MKGIVEFNKEDLDVTVQAGIGYIELNEKLKDYGLWFPLDPGPGASIGNYIYV
jgi:D-lactate dehydrogenase (cytochrome)